MDHSGGDTHWLTTSDSIVMAPTASALFTICILVYFELYSQASTPSMPPSLTMLWHPHYLLSCLVRLQGGRPSLVVLSQWTAASHLMKPCGTW